VRSSATLYDSNDFPDTYRARVADVVAALGAFEDGTNAFGAWLIPQVGE
jgi:hypothetical protein